MLQEIKSAIIEKSGLNHKEISEDFESSDFFLQILDKKRSELPEDHYIRPFLSEGDQSLGEIHFLPNGNATANLANRTEILLIGIDSLLQEYYENFEDVKKGKELL